MSTRQVIQEFLLELNTKVLPLLVNLKRGHENASGIRFGTLDKPNEVRELHNGRWGIPIYGVFKWSSTDDKKILDSFPPQADAEVFHEETLNGMHTEIRFRPTQLPTYTSLPTSSSQRSGINKCTTAAFVLLLFAIAFYFLVQFLIHKYEITDIPYPLSLCFIGSSGESGECLEGGSKCFPPSHSESVKGPPPTPPPPISKRPLPL